jgi:tetratricopeptide (TPR) repeat protein
VTPTRRWSCSQAGRHEEAVADYRAAMAEAEQFGARGHKALLACRLAGALWELGADEESEAILRQVIEDEDAATHEARPAARLFLGLQLPHRGHTDEARALLRELRRDSDVAYFVVFDSMVLIAEAWAEAVDGVWDACLGFVRRALEQAADPLSDTVAPQVRPLTLTLAALVLASTDGGARARDAARLLGAAGARPAPPHVAGRMEREVTGRAVRAVRAALGDEPYETARAEGAALTFAEAAALV